MASSNLFYSDTPASLLQGCLGFTFTLVMSAEYPLCGMCGMAHIHNFHGLGYGHFWEPVILPVTAVKGVRGGHHLPLKYEGMGFSDSITRNEQKQKEPRQERMLRSF